MASRSSAILLTIFCAILVAACAPGVTVPDLPTASSSPIIAPTETSTPAPTYSVPTATLAPPLVALSAQPPFRAWIAAPDDGLYGLDAVGRILLYRSDLSAADAASAPLFGGADPGPANLAADAQFLIVSSAALSRTIALQRETFAPLAAVDLGGQVALGPGGKLFLLAEDAVWAYDVANLGALPRAVTKWPVDPFTPRPRNLAVDAAGSQLLVTLHDISASPPHQQEWYAAYDLATLQPLRAYPSQLGELTRPSVGGGRIVAGMAAKNGFLGSKVAAFDRQGHEAAAAKPLDGRPLIDAAGEWIYVLRERGTWVLQASDLSLVAVAPYASEPPLDLLLSADGETLYEVRGDGVAGRQTADLRAAGIAPLTGPLPANWFYGAQPNYAFAARFFPVTDDIAFVQVGGYGETWRSTDAGQMWRLLPGLVHPNFHYVTHLSISPDFAQDQTLVAVSFASPAYLRSIDGGDTWSAWEPPVAFVSDRDGNREIYTADRGTLGGGPAQNLARRTNNLTAEENPAWSPGWTRIAFQSNRNGNWDIFTIRADCDPIAADAAACDLRQLTDDPADDMLPAWSPDGRWIAFVSTRSGTPQIYVVPATGGAATQLTTGPSGSWRPAWWTDSLRLFLTGAGANGSNDIQRLGHIWTLDSEFDAPELLSVVDSPADERDAAVARESFVYLSNASGIPRTYRRYNYDMATGFPITPGTEPEGHPAPLDDDTGTLLVTLEREGRTGIYRATSSGYEPFVVDGQFNGQPAAGPVPWQPDPDISQYKANQWQAQE